MSDRNIDDGHDDIIYPHVLSFVLIHLSCVAAFWSGITWQAIVIGDVILAFPIAAALSAAAVQGVDPRIRRTAETLGAGTWRTAWTVAREARFALAAVITAAFGQVVAEVGAAMIVGGNIRGSTRTLTTAVALYTAQGDFGLALALGIILLVMALVVNIALQLLQGRGSA